MRETQWERGNERETMRWDIGRETKSKTQWERDNMRDNENDNKRETRRETVPGTPGTPPGALGREPPLPVAYPG